MTYMAGTTLEPGEPLAPPRDLTPDGLIVIATMIVCVLLMALLTAVYSVRVRPHPQRARLTRRLQ